MSFIVPVRWWIWYVYVLLNINTLVLGGWKQNQASQIKERSGNSWATYTREVMEIEVINICVYAVKYKIVYLHSCSVGDESKPS